MDIINDDIFPRDSLPSNKLETICRACLNLGTQLQNLYQSDFGQQFSYCTSLEISEYDGLPAWLCQPCCNLLEHFYSFKQLCCRSDAIIKSSGFINKTFHKPIKQEKEIFKNDHFTLNSSENSDSSLKDKESFIDDATNDVTSPKHLNGNQYEMLSLDDSDDFDKQVKKKTSHLFAKKIFRCIVCPKAFKSSGRLEKHSKIHKKIKLKDIVVSDTFSGKCNTDGVDDKLKSQLTCSSCDQRFFKYHKLEAHMRGHFGIVVEGVTCDVCKKKLKNAESLRVHMITHSGEKKYKCSTCDKTFAHKCALKVHERIHSGVKKYVCHICGDKFVQDANLKIHLLRHTGEKPHACDRCDKRFTQTGDLKRHMLRHEGIKNYPCSACHLRFCSKQEQAKHLLSHSGAKPFACDICGKTFKTQSFIAVHRRTHTGERPFQCEFCKRKFMAGKDLRNHRMIHTGEKPNKCHLCSQAFIQKSALNRHVKCHNKYQGAAVQTVPHPPPVIALVEPENCLNGNTPMEVTTF